MLGSVAPSTVWTRPEAAQTAEGGLMRIGALVLATLAAGAVFTAATAHADVPVSHAESQRGHARRKREKLF